MKVSQLCVAAGVTALLGITCGFSALAEPEASPSNPTISPGPSPSPAVTVAPNATVGDVPADGESPVPVESGDSQEYPTIRKGNSGDEVILIQMRLRDLGYFNYKITNYYGSLTETAVKSFQRENDLPADGTVGPVTCDALFSNKAIRKPIVPIATPTPKPTKKPAGYVAEVPIGVMTDWSKVTNLWPRGTNLLVIDVETGAQMTFQRVGGQLHADVEPLTAEDTVKLKRCYGGTWNWSRRAVVVKVNGTWTAASINGYPHGKETVPNNDMVGQVCIHFLNSRTHIRNMKDPDHQAMVRKAAGQ